VPGAKPLYRFYIADAEGKINFKDEAFAVWEAVTKDGNKTYLSGKTKDGRRVQGWPVLDKPDTGQYDQQQPTNQLPPDDTDTPF
jgi:hypothetical protein